MVIKNSTIERIRKIIEKNYNRLAIALVGPSNVPQEIRDQFPNLTSRSLLEAVYYHNFLNEEGREGNPRTYEEMKEQQDTQNLPRGSGHEASIDFLNSNLYQLLQKQKTDVESKVVGLIRDNNNQYKNDALQNLDRPDEEDASVKKRTIPELKQRLKEFGEGEAQNNWSRITNTEISNGVGQGSADQVVARNKGTPTDQIYVFRINPNDAKTCKYCRKFYIDSDGSPKVYRLSSLLSNGTNYGKKADAWLPVAQATHPNCRDSQLIELRPGWSVLPGGTVTYIGMDRWADYINKKVAY